MGLTTPVDQKQEKEAKEREIKVIKAPYHDYKVRKMTP